jgi:uncharacterized protein YciI
MRTEGESSVIITARACPVPARPYWRKPLARSVGRRTLWSAGRKRRSAAQKVDGAPTGRQALLVAEWVYFIHPPREDFAATMTEEEQVVWALHFARLERLLAEGTMILVGPTLGRINTGIAIFEAPDEETARRIMEEDPVIEGDFARGELRPFRLSLLRGRD